MPNANRIPLDEIRHGETNSFLYNADTVDYLRKVETLFVHDSRAIPVSTIRNTLKSTHLKNHLTRRQKVQILMATDKNKDQKISYEELKNMLSKSEDNVDYRKLTTVNKITYLAVSSVGLPGQAENYLEYYHCSPPPLFMLLISLIEIAIFVYYGVTLEQTLYAIKSHSGGVSPNSPLIWLGTRRYEVWRFISYMLLHSGYLHITFNVLYQLLYGIPLEMVHRWRILVIYFVGVLAGSCSHSLFDPLPLVGASGGGYSLLGAHLANVIMNWREMNAFHKYGLLRVLMSAYFRVILLAVLIITDLSVSLTKFYTDPTSTTGYAGHLGGFLSGVLMGILLLDLNQLPWEAMLKKLATIILLSFAITVILYNCLSDSFPPTDWRACCPVWF